MSTATISQINVTTYTRRQPASPTSASGSAITAIPAPSQTASISYNVPLSGDGLFQSMRLSAIGQNLFLITGYSGLDPEVSTSDIPANGLPSASIDYLSYPRPRTFSLGINVKF